jgi:hypothetical protein
MPPIEPPFGMVVPAGGVSKSSVDAVPVKPEIADMNVAGSVMGVADAAGQTRSDKTERQAAVRA